MAGGAVFNYSALRHYRAVYPPPGRVYRVAGYDMHLYCAGSGSPTVVLESGLGDSFLSWAKVQPKLSQLTRVCSYDRAGLGWSEARPGTRDSNAIAEQLHLLLQKSGTMNEPFVLMGHSAAGLHMRVYRARYPKDIAGIVFVDPSTPGQFAAFMPEGPELDQRELADARREKWEAAVGLTRLLGKCGAVPPGSEAWAGWLKASDSDCDPALYTAQEREMAAFKLSGKEAAPTGPWGGLPILILSSDPDVWGTDWSGFPEALRKKWASAWSSLHEDLKQLSTRSRRVVAKGSHHYVQNDRPELVIDEAEHFIRQLRDPAGIDSDGGTTVVR
jgi:pimeloyl-ACP methyl ester carboxylesterase